MVWEQSWKPADIPLCQRAGLGQVAVQSCSPVYAGSHCCDPFPTAGVVLGVGLEAFRLGFLGRHAQPRVQGLGWFKDGAVDPYTFGLGVTETTIKRRSFNL